MVAPAKELLFLFPKIDKVPETSPEIATPEPAHKMQQKYSLILKIFLTLFFYSLLV